MKTCIFLTLLATMSVSGCASKADTPTRYVIQENKKELLQEEINEWQETRKRFMDERYESYLNTALWALTHSADGKEAEELLKTLRVFFEAVETDDPSVLKKIGGFKGFKDILMSFLNNKDAVVQGQSAILLGITGDRKYVRDIAKQLKKESNRPTEQEKWDPSSSDRGQAAMALGLLGAIEYAQDLVLLLQSSNPYDRAGAAKGLGIMGAKKQAKSIADLLNDENDDVKKVAIDSLALMEAKEYTNHIAKLLSDENPFETRRTAVYALVKMKAREYAQEIRELLDDEFVKGDAAKALAFMGAYEYAEDIAKLLKDENALNRRDAILALGLMKATRYDQDVSKYLKDKEKWVGDYAALSLVLMEAQGYASEVVERIENVEPSRNLLKDSGFPLILWEEYIQTQNRFNQSLKKLKSYN